MKLLPLPDPNVHISKFGYHLYNSDLSRHRALSKISDNIGDLAVLRRLNLIRNLTHKSANKSILSRDVEYMKKQYIKNKH